MSAIADWGLAPKPPVEKTKEKKCNAIVITFAYWIILMKNPTSTKRTKSITVWLTDAEYQELQDKKTNARIGAWVRDTCLGVKSKKRKYKPVEPLLLRELGKIGGNLNQIAKHANTGALGGKIDRLRLLGELAVIREQLDELLNRYDS